ncbi:SRPBCC family protein [Methylocystis heyeri]|uniref:SRPBCC family protein n=1 Tax=Methylocystis heyeri TaxID=391905 RepID=A0A6B8KD28_9HYPH|nr:SRPBCC family protein [Methylocystis heyeri]QGM45609.1 SRPBCC family protein [Methylocystis heyeri]
MTAQQRLRSPLRFAWVLAIALAALTPLAAFGHGATPQKVIEAIEIDAPPARVWAVVGDFQDASWLPGVVRSEGEGGNTPETGKRRLFLANGAAIDERLVQYDESAMSLRYLMEHVDIKVLPVGNLSATLKVSPAGAGSLVEWKSRFYRAFPGGNPPEQFTDEIAVQAVTDLFRSGLANLKARVERR